MSVRRKKRRIGAKAILGLSPYWFTVLAGLFLLVLIGAFLVGEFYLFVRNPMVEVDVPDFVGMKFSDAETQANKVKLNLNISKLVYSNDVDKDYIIDQTPSAGIRVKGGRTVSLTVSEGRRNIPAPNLLGMHGDEAMEKLEAMGLGAVEPQMRYSDEAPSGTVINQSPPPGTPVAQGEKIRTIVSKGPQIKSIEMPDLKGMPLSEAMTTLEQVGLRVTKITRVYSPAAHGETIASQAPAPGRTVKRGSEVILTVSVPAYQRSLGEHQFRVVVNVPASEEGIDVSIIKNDFQETKEIYREVVQGPARIEKLVDAYGSTTISIYFNGELYREESF